MTPKWAIVCLILLVILILELMLLVTLPSAWQAGANVIPLWIAP
jgi:competence protein ComGC